MCRPASIAEREVVCDDGDDTLALAIDDARRDHPSGIASKAHTHREGLLAVGSTSAEELIEVEGNTREVTEVFEEREEGEEDCHRGEHHRDDPRHGEIHPIDEEAREPPRTAPACECLLEERM